MITTIAEQILYFILTLPIILLALKNWRAENLKILITFLCFYLLNAILLYLPIEFETFRIVESRWNWSGKLIAIAGSILFLLFYRKFTLKDYYLTLRPNTQFLKTGMIFIALLLSAQSILTILYDSPKEWNMETILFQLTLPGIEEEIAYRGIMLGLLVKILKPFFGVSFLHPAIIITSILFGFAHGLSLSDSFELRFDSFAFSMTFISAMLWGWMTMKSGSILLALISHNLGNVTNKLIRMI